MRIPYKEKCEMMATFYKYDFNNKNVEDWIKEFRNDCKRFNIKELDVLRLLLWEGELLEK